LKLYINVLLVTVLLIFTCIVLPEEFIIENGQWFYAIQFLVIFMNLLRVKNNYIYFFSPSFLCLAYLNFNFFLGQMVVARGIGFDLKYYNAFKNFESVSFITAFFLLCNLMVFLSISFKSFNKIINIRFIKSNLNTINKSKVLFLFLILFFLGYVKINLSFLGGQGDFIYVFKLAVSILIVFIISDYKSKIRFLLYFFIICLFFNGSFNSKREILYVIILIVFFEFLRNKINVRIKLKQFLLFSFGFAFIFYLVIIASIMRGYGNYNVNDSINASKYVLDYISSETATKALASNFELNYLYGNSSNAVNYIYSGEEKYLYGSTFLKFLFIPIPRSLFPEKPLSMIDIYTNKFDPSFRSIGGSYPVIIYSESYWNFSLLAFPFLYLIFSLFNRFYLKVVGFIERSNISIYSVFLIFMYITLIQFIRGSGFELWLLYGIIPILFIGFLIKFLRLNKILNSNKE
jgi:hypothetical protein